MQQQLTKNGVKHINYSQEQDQTKEDIDSSSSQYSSDSDYGIKYKKRTQSPIVGQNLELHPDNFAISDGILTITNLSDSQHSNKKSSKKKIIKRLKSSKLINYALKPICEEHEEAESIVEHEPMEFSQVLLESNHNSEGEEEYYDEGEYGEDEQSEYEQNYLDKEIRSGCGCEPRVLIVDDIQMNIYPVRCMIRNFTQFIEEAGDGQIAVDMFEQSLKKPCGCPNRTYKLIFMDLQMPVKGGYEASLEIFKLLKEARKEKRLLQRLFQLKEANSDFEQIQYLENILQSEKIDDNLFDSDELKPTQDEEKTECRIVVLTSCTVEEEFSQCLSLGCSQVLYKPIHYEKLHEIMWRHFFRVGYQEYLKIYQDQFDKPFLN